MLKKISFYSSILSIVLLIFAIVSTYAKYSTEFDKNANLNITKWKILINDTDVLENSDISSTIVPTFTSSEHIADNVIVPTSSGYFDIEIDSSNTNLSFEYELTLTNTSQISDFVITGYSLNSDPTMIPYNNTSIIGQILYSDNIDITTLRIYIEWDDSQNNITNNAEDTSLAQSNATGNIGVNISINQIEDDYSF